MLTIIPENTIKADDSIPVMNAKLKAIAEQSTDISIDEYEKLHKYVEDRISDEFHIQEEIVALCHKNTKTYKNIEEVIDDDAHPIISFNMVVKGASFLDKVKGVFSK